MKKLIMVILSIVAFTTLALSEVKVVTSLPDIADIVKEIGKEKVKVDHIVQGNQNPHYIDVKPSYMLRLKSADIFFTIGMELEMWAPQIIDGSRNDHLQVIDLSKNISKLEVPERLDASQGDVHRFGNPHYWLDPRNIRIISGEIVTALASVSPSDEQYFKENAEAYLKRLDIKIKEWEDEARQLKNVKIITFHKSWSYFANWLGLDVVDYIEPQPGIQPSPSHTAELIRKVRQFGIKVIAVEQFYDTSAPEEIARVTGAKVVPLITSVGGAPETTNYINLMDYNIRTLIAVCK